MLYVAVRGVPSVAVFTLTNVAVCEKPSVLVTVTSDESSVETFTL